MRPLIVFSDMTLDGFMAGPDNDLDFMTDDPQMTSELTGELMAVADTRIWAASRSRRRLPTGQPPTAIWLTG